MSPWYNAARAAGGRHLPGTEWTLSMDCGSREYETTPRAYHFAKWWLGRSLFHTICSLGVTIIPSSRAATQSHPIIAGDQLSAGHQHQLVPSDTLARRNMGIAVPGHKSVVQVLPKIWQKTLGCVSRRHLTTTGPRRPRLNSLYRLNPAIGVLRAKMSGTGNSSMPKEWPPVDLIAGLALDKSNEAESELDENVLSGKAFASLRSQFLPFSKASTPLSGKSHLAYCSLSTGR